MIWPIPPQYRLVATVCGALAALLVGIVIGVLWQAPKTRAAESHGQAVAANLVASWEKQRADAEAEARRAQEQERQKGEDRERELQADLERIRRDAAARGPAVVRVPVPAHCPRPGAGADPPGATAVRPGAAADGPGVGVDGEGGDRGPYLELDVTGIWLLVDTGKAVSERLRALQDVCR